MRGSAAVATVLLLLVLGACDRDGDPAVTPTAGAQAGELGVTSTAFAEAERIPAEHTCEGEDTLPPLSWSTPPPEAVNVMVVVDDPDAPDGPFTHLAVTGLSPDLEGLDGGLPPDVVVGVNGFGEPGWAGPCPPPQDGPHRYRFTVTATSEHLDLEPGFSIRDLADAAAGTVVAQGTLTGTFDR